MEDIKKGKLDAYYFRIPLDSVNNVKKNQKINIYERIGGTIGLLINPAPSQNPDSINPFQFKDIRFVLNYIFDRQRLTEDLLYGHGYPLLDPYGIFSPEYPNIINIVESYKVKYDPVYADEVISQTLLHANATKENGKWFFHGNPITLIVFIRNDDFIRNSLGELTVRELEKLGFMVKREFGDLNKAQRMVYGSDPQDLNWHIYIQNFLQEMIYL